MPTESSKARSPSPGSSKQILCIADQSLTFSKDHLRQSQNHNKPYLTSGHPRPERLNAVVQAVLVPRSRRRHESTNRAGHLWDKPGHDDGWIYATCPERATSSAGDGREQLLVGFADDAVTAAPLGGVEADVGCLDQGLRVCRVVQGGDAD